jgi:predicted PurR-regulated permease PerM
MVTIALSIIGGTTEFGVLGIVLGPLIISLRLAVLQEPRRIAVGGRDPLPRTSSPTSP